MDFSEITRELILIEPFLGHFLLGVQKDFSDIVPTAGVTIDGLNPRIYFNEKFCDSLSDDHQIGLLWHEVEHIVNFHVIPDFYNSFDDKEILNIAEDIHINQNIDFKYLPPKAMLPSTFPKLKLPTFADTRTYYDLLQQDQESSNPDPKLKSLIDHMKSGKPHAYDHSLHGKGSNSEEASNVLSDVIKNEITNQLMRTYEQYGNNSVGNVPSHLRGLLTSLLNKSVPALDWKAALRRFGSRCANTETKMTRNKPNPRYPDSATIKIRRKEKIAVAIDTSGSVSNSELNDFFDQIDYISKTGVKIEIIECDSRIGRVYEYKDRKQVGKITGGGGTCAQPVLDLINSDNKYNSVVYFTDGGLFDSQKKKGLKPVLWIITSNGTDQFKFDGPKIKMQPSKN